VKVTPKGEMVPHAAGLRSPNGVAFSPEGDLFYCDNQGEWVATNKMHHVREGDNYGHQASLIWTRHSPFAKTIAESYPSGMLYDGQMGKAKAAGMPGQGGDAGRPAVTPPCIWFPYGRMGQSVSEPCWDTTAGKFGPFAGQCFVGDQTRAIVMRVALEKVNGRYQGACFPFRSGLQCGVNRLAFGPDGSLYAGQTRAAGVVRRQGLRFAATRLHRRVAVRDPHGEADGGRLT
jgi:sugar lactone lactonase YvrE